MKKGIIWIICILLVAAAVAVAFVYFDLGAKLGIGGGGPKVGSGDRPKFEIVMENGEIMRGELYPDAAPQTVGNFIALANAGFYDGLTFHNVVPGFMIEGGDPTDTGTGGPGYSIKGEFAANGIENGIKHTVGVMSMARGQSFDSAGSRFFIMVSDMPDIDGQNAAFGKVLEGMDKAALTIVNSPVQGLSGAPDAMNRPVDLPVIKTIRVETNGKTYPFDKN